MKWVGLALQLLVAAGCGRPAADPDRVGDMTPREIARFTDRALAAYDAIASAAERAGSDCDGLAAALPGLLAPRIDLLVHAMQASADPVFLYAGEAELEARRERTAVLARRLDAAFATCADRPGVAALLRMLD
jgi:hypothetical protein